MFAIIAPDFEKHGCPNCGCDTAKIGPIYMSGITYGTCVYCGLKFEIRDSLQTRPNLQCGIYPVDPRDPDSPKVKEHGYLLYPHPRADKNSWRWEPCDERPGEDNAEFWKPRQIGADLSGFVCTRYAGERIHDMVKRVLEKEEIESYLDYRPKEPMYIQYKLSPNEFNLKKVYKLTERDGILSESILKECVKREKQLF